MSTTKPLTDTAWAIVAWFTVDPGTAVERQERQVWRAGLFDSPEDALAQWNAEDREPTDVIGYVQVNADPAVVHK